MELLDVYNENFEKTGKIVPRRTILPENEFVLCTHILIQDMEGRFLVQKRSDTKSTRPGEWDITAGAVDSGEDSRIAAIREAKEEVGLDVPGDKMQFLFRDRIGGAYHEAWCVRMPFALEDCTMQESEVQDLRLVTAEELLVILEQFPHRSEDYKQEKRKFLRQFCAEEPNLKK